MALYMVNCANSMFNRHLKKCVMCFCVYKWNPSLFVFIAQLYSMLRLISISVGAKHPFSLQMLTDLLALADSLMLSCKCGDFYLN